MKFRHRFAVAILFLVTFSIYLITLNLALDEKETLTLKGNILIEIKYERNNSANLSKTEQLGNKNKSPAIVNPDRFNYLLNEPNMCNSDVDLIVLLITAPDHFIQRLVIRSTWGSVKKVDSFNVKLVFLLGHSHRPKTNEAIKLESKAHRDIIQESFKDTYRNLTLKTIMGLKWVSKHCPNAKFILKCDDDVFVNIYSLAKYLELFQQEGKPNELFIMCRLNNGLVNRNNQSKWYVTENEYLGKEYPPYCDGPAYLFSQKTAKSLYNATFYTPLFWLEDVYTTGIVAAKLKVNHTAINSKYHHAEILSQEMIHLRLTITKLYLFANAHFSEQMMELWNIVKDDYDDRKKRKDHHIPVYLEDSERLKRNQRLLGERSSK